LPANRELSCDHKETNQLAGAAGFGAVVGSSRHADRCGRVVTALEQLLPDPPKPDPIDHLGDDIVANLKIQHVR